MEYKIEIIILGKICTKKYQMTGRKMYRNKETKVFEEAVGYIAKNYMQKRSLTPLHGAIALRLINYIYSKKNINPDGSMKSIYCTEKPDNTNVLKSIEDGLKNICFGDDKSVVDTHVTKYFCDSPLKERVEIFITDLIE